MYKIAVIGRGLIGSAAGRHLSMISDGVAVIGPGEPVVETILSGIELH